MSWSAVGGSFRDPSGFVYTRDGTLYRQVNRSFGGEFDAFVASGLYDELAADGLLLPHRPAAPELAATADAHDVLEPERLGFISYPYEWTFGQLQDAALLTLEIHRRAVRRGFVLRDASAYNVQFRGGRPVFIDTLSFERNPPGRPWQAYRQFCEHFLAPLLLMSRRDVRVGQLLRRFLDGIPLDLASALLPMRSWASFGTLIHLHLHARAQKRYADASVSTVARGRSMSPQALQALAGSLEASVRALRWTPAGTEWADYTTDNSYSEAAGQAKRSLISRLLAAAHPRVVWDVGANTGDYSRLARESAALVIAFDADPAAVERNYRRTRAAGDMGLLPLVMDVTNPSPAQGWAHAERMSLEERGPADTVMALALVHHLAISNNLPLSRIARCFARLGRTLIIEFVPKSDVQVRRLLLNREDIFPEYTQEGFERAFSETFRICEAHPVADSDRRLYLMARREGAA
jgi:hypothetical protein